MDNNADIREFVAKIRRQLPSEAEKADALMRVRGFDIDEELDYLWIEALADVTNACIRRRNQQAMEHQFRFFSEQFDRGSEAVRKCIDVSYVENLMWELSSEDKKWAWLQLPENLQNLYIMMWGNPRF
jgi:hypothetical protein